MKGIKIIQTEIHLKTFKVKGGISNKVANFPTIKFPDQNKEAKTSSEYAKYFFDNKLLTKSF